MLENLCLDKRKNKSAKFSENLSVLSIMVKKGLKIDVNMYTMKHARAKAKILAGIDLDVLLELYGHTSKLMTMRYAKCL